MSRDKIPLSVAIITYNEEDIIGRTLEAVHNIASEIVVVDSHSTDKTREIAESFGAKVFVEDWKGYSAQKNSALEKCTQEWILFLDADEIVSEELKESIVKELHSPRADGYLINRRTYYMGKFLKYTWQPEWRLRLVRRESNPKWVGNIHEKLVYEGRTDRLKGDLLHFPYRSLKHQFQKGLDFAYLDAQEKFSQKRTATLLDVALRPIWAFFKTFLLKKAFLDGYRGFFVALSSSVYTLMRYMLLFEMKEREKCGEDLWKRKSPW